MQRNLILGFIIVIAFVIIAATALKGNVQAPASSSATPTPLATATPEVTASPTATSSVTINNFSFSPAAITVKAGTTVTWTNQDTAGHTVVGDSQGGPSSSLLNQGQSYSFTFTAAGTFAYHCGVHPSMVGSVTVTE